MWKWSKVELLTLLLGNQERDVDAPSKTKPTSKVKPAVGSQEWYRQLPPSTNNSGISMNELARRIPRPKPPCGPGRQSRRFNGIWWHY